MDHFERQLTRLMHDTREHQAFETAHRDRLRAGVRARRRVRTARRAAGSVLAVAGLGLGLLLWPHAPGTDQPGAPRPRPAVSPVPAPAGTPSPQDSPSMPPSSFPTRSPDPGGATETSQPPATRGGSGPTTGAPPTGTATATATARNTLTAPPPATEPETSSADPSYAASTTAEPTP
ncbi:hypothetical protein [Streptomyces collinus]|uniref:hypothetical protein n=1 Tax=Streptomyces collinus TaxID=42684 RepID=UPI002942619B|nr:hypothetical protein [Streptomyces collinus]